MKIIGVDPGPTETALCLTDGSNILHAEKVCNEDAIDHIKDMLFDYQKHVAIESIQSYGAPVGRETFLTCYMIGRIIQVCVDRRVDHFLYPRQEYANAICGGKANDSILRQALLLRFGGDKKGEPLNMLKGASDKRSAFAVAIYHLDMQRYSRKQF